MQENTRNRKKMQVALVAPVSQATQNTQSYASPFDALIKATQVMNAEEFKLPPELQPNEDYTRKVNAL